MNTFLELLSITHERRRLILNHLSLNLVHSYSLPYQSRSFENFVGGSVDCLKITEDRSSDNRVHISDARMIKAIDAVSKRRV